MSQSTLRALRLALVQQVLDQTVSVSGATLTGPLVVPSLRTAGLAISDDTSVVDSTGPPAQAYLRLRINDVVYRVSLRSDLLAPRPFIILIDATDSTLFTLPLISDGKYNFSVQWGDGTESSITSADDPQKVHTYATTGTKTITITGLVFGWRFDGNADAPKILEVQQWGSDFYLGAPAGSPNEGRYFAGCSNLIITASDTPDLSLTRSLSSCFFGCSNLTGPSISDWNVSTITNLGAMFLLCTTFNEPLNDWDVSRCTNMFLMFLGAAAFNQNLDQWDTSSVTNMYGLFDRASNFAGAVGTWDTAKVTNMERMFYNCRAFNRDLSTWDVSSVETFKQMFESDGERKPMIFNNGETGLQAIPNIAGINTATYTSSTKTLVCTNLADNVDVGDVIVVRGTTTPSGDDIVIVSGVVDSKTTPSTVVFAASPAPENQSFNAGFITSIQKQVQGTKPLSWSMTSAKDISGMFNNCPFFNQDVRSWSTSLVTNASSCFRGPFTSIIQLFNNGQLITESSRPMGWTFADGANLTNFRLNCRLTNGNKPAAVA